jgi:DNA-binding IclR family transcriptional regulator
MACVNPDGTLSVSAQTVINALQQPLTVPALAQTVNLPVYRLRSSLRELVEVGFVTEENGTYRLTPQGQQKVA